MVKTSKHQARNDRISTLAKLFKVPSSLAGLLIFSNMKSKSSNMFESDFPWICFVADSLTDND